MQFNCNIYSCLRSVCCLTAKINQFCIIFAVKLHKQFNFTRALRFACKFHVISCNLCSSTASIMQFYVVFAVQLQMQCSLLSSPFRLILVCFWWVLMVFRVVIVAVERGRRNVGFLLFSPFSGWFSAGRNLFRALLLRWKCGVELAKSLHAGCRRACYSFLASMACVMSASNSSQSSGLSCSNVFVASRPCANLESL